MTNDSEPTSGAAVSSSEMVRQLSDDNRKLSESQTFLRRILAAVAENAGGEIIVDDLALVKTALNPTILTWTDEQLRLHIKVRTELSNDKLSHTAPTTT